MSIATTHKPLPIDASALPDRELFAEEVDRFMDEVWAEREARLRAWSKEKLTIREIAERTGRGKSTISEWQHRFGIKPKQPKKVSGTRTLSPGRMLEAIHALASAQQQVATALADGIDPAKAVPADEQGMVLAQLDQLDITITHIRKALS